MPSHQYSRVATVEDVDEHGIPTNAPPSFEAPASSISDFHLPHKSGETATIIMPQSEREKNLMDDKNRELLKSDDRDLEEALRQAHNVSREVPMRWKVAVVVFVMLFSTTVFYGVARKLCMKKA